MTPREGAAIDLTSATSSITVKEIVDTINAAPPLQREDLSQHYQGIIVEWVGYLRSADTDFADKKRVRVSLNVDKSRGIGYSFWFSEKLESIPELKTLMVNSKLRVKGSILSASGSGLCVTIKPMEIAIVERSHE